MLALYRRTFVAMLLLTSGMKTHAECVGENAENERKLANLIASEIRYSGIQIDYPVSAVRASVEGDAIVRFHFSEAGISRATLAKSTGNSALDGSIARAALVLVERINKDIFANKKVCIGPELIMDWPIIFDLNKGDRGDPWDGDVLEPYPANHSLEGRRP